MTSSHCQSELVGTKESDSRSCCKDTPLVGVDAGGPEVAKDADKTAEMAGKEGGNATGEAGEAGKAMTEGEKAMAEGEKTELPAGQMQLSADLLHMVMWGKKTAKLTTSFAQADRAFLDFDYLLFVSVCAFVRYIWLGGQEQSLGHSSLLAACN